MKTVILNGSPRKDWNTAQLLHAAEKGARSAGDAVTYIDLYDLNYTGCRSCLACKRKGVAEPCRCWWQDDLTPVLQEIYSADRLILGSPIYFGQPTSQFRALLERLCFPPLSYNDYSKNNFAGKVDVDIFLTMNVGQGFYEEKYAERFQVYMNTLRCLGGAIRIHPVCDTMQVEDYAKYDMDGFDSAQKVQHHETQFPKDLEYAEKIGANK